MLVLLIEGIYELVVKMDSGALIYTSSCIKFGSAIQKLIAGIHIHTQRQQGDLLNLFFSQNKESKLKTLILPVVMCCV
jgi:hypothetical protein